MDMSMSMDMSMPMSSSTMDMSSSMTMDMSSSMSMPTSMSMSMDMSSSMSMAMPMPSASSTASSMPGMDMGGSGDSSSSMSMMMPMYMSTKYDNVPVFFKTLHAQNGAGAFGIFCVLFFCSFAFRGLVFLSSYLEQAVFHNYSNTIIVEEDCECGPDSVDKEYTPNGNPATINASHQSFGLVLKKLFFLTPKQMFQDIIRLVLAFTIVMFGYAIMLAAMSFVVTYFFAICLGLAFADVFFNRLAIILNINKSFGACSSFH